MATMTTTQTTIPTTIINRKPYTREAAERIARAGANKMDAQGYTWKHDGFSGNAFIVTKPETQDEPSAIYNVTLSNGGVDGVNTELQACSCPFCDNGFNRHTCKHCVFVIDGVKAEMEADQARANDFSEYDTYGKYDLLAGKF